MTFPPNSTQSPTDTKPTTKPPQLKGAALLLSAALAAADEACAACHKSQPLCICSAVAPQKTRLFTLFLQHPQEPDKDLGTAHLAHMGLTRSALKVGLSWPNLKAATAGTGAPLTQQPKNWAVLYLGSTTATRPGLTLVDKKGSALVDSDELLGSIGGLIILDGTWSQAKALWWRNPWLLKCRRAVLRADKPSLYGKLRREPRKECLSTVEAAGYSLAQLEENPALTENLFKPFKKLIENYNNAT